MNNTPVVPVPPIERIDINKNVDPPIHNQLWTCVSFITPEKIIKQRDHYMFEEFVKQWDMAKSMEKFQLFVNFIAFKYKLRNDGLIADLQDFVTEQRKEIQDDSLLVYNDYQGFLEQNEEVLGRKFDIDHNFQTSVRSVKIRGSFATEEEAKARAELLRAADPVAVDIAVGPVGTWLIWDPEAYKTGKVDFLEDELNQLYVEKQKNESIAKMNFDARIQDAKDRAVKENRERAELSHATVSQGLDEGGNLVGTSTYETEIHTAIGTSGGSITTNQLTDLLFNSDNIVAPSSAAAAAVAESNAKMLSRLG